MPTTAEPYGILITGIGGTGVVTVGQILAMAAHVEGKGAIVLDMSGLAQKGGPVMSHERLADKPADLRSARAGHAARNPDHPAGFGEGFHEVTTGAAAQ